MNPPTPVAAPSANELVKRLQRELSVSAGRGNVLISFGLLEEAIAALSHAEPEAWIPVKDRLPPYGKRVLVTVEPIGDYAYVAQDRWREGSSEYADHWGDYSRVIAWRELPPPYKAGV